MHNFLFFSIQKKSYLSNFELLCFRAAPIARPFPFSSVVATRWSVKKLSDRSTMLCALCEICFVTPMSFQVFYQRLKICKQNNWKSQPTKVIFNFFVYKFCVFDFVFIFATFFRWWCKWACCQYCGFGGCGWIPWIGTVHSFFVQHFSSPYWTQCSWQKS